MSLVALGTWLVVLARMRRVIRHSALWPDPVTEGALVAVVAACAGGTIASMGFNGMIGDEASAAVAIAWRAAVAASGVYAIIGSAMDGRSD